MDCYTSSDPVAVNASLLFDLNNDEDNLWIRTSQGLSPCPSPPPDSQCIVCLEDRVYAVCRTLSDGVKLAMQTETQQVEIFKSGCPELPSDVGPELPSEDAPQWLLPVALILLFIFIILSLVVYFCCCQGRQRFSRVNNGTLDKDGSSETS